VPKQVQAPRANEEEIGVGFHEASLRGRFRVIAGEARRVEVGRPDESGTIGLPAKRHAVPPQTTS
jgi:hypothetical protein